MLPACGWSCSNLRRYLPPVLQYAALQQKYYSLEVQLRQLQKSHSQQAPDVQQHQHPQQQQQETSSPTKKTGFQAAQKQQKQKQAALVKLRGKHSQARGWRTGESKHGPGTESAAAEAGVDGVLPQGSDVGAEHSDVSSSSSSRDDGRGHEGRREEEWEAGGGGEAAAMWQQRCRTLQEANRQLRQQLLKVANGAVGDVGQMQVNSTPGVFWLQAAIYAEAYF
jgi:hypothetical protein